MNLSDKRGTLDRLNTFSVRNGYQYLYLEKDVKQSIKNILRRLDNLKDINARLIIEDEMGDKLIDSPPSVRCAKESKSSKVLAEDNNINEVGK